MNLKLLTAAVLAVLLANSWPTAASDDAGPVPDDVTLHDWLDQVPAVEPGVSAEVANCLVRVDPRFVQANSAACLPPVTVPSVPRLPSVPPIPSIPSIPTVPPINVPTLCEGGGVKCLIPDVPSLPSAQLCSTPEVGVVVDGKRHCVSVQQYVDLVPCGVNGKQDCMTFLCGIQSVDCTPNLPTVPSAQLCQSPKVGLIVEGKSYCIDAQQYLDLVPCGVKGKPDCVSYLCSFQSVDCTPDLPFVQVCPPPLVGVIVEGQSLCVMPPPTPQPCTAGFGIQPNCHSVRLCDGGTVGLEVDSMAFCQGGSLFEPCPDSYGFGGNCHTVQPCDAGRTGYRVDGSSATCVSGVGGLGEGVGDLGGIGSPCNLAGASRSCNVNTEPGMQVMRAAPPDAEDAQILARIAAAPKCVATSTLRHHAGLGIDVEALQLSCPDYSQLIPSTIPPPAVPGTKVPQAPDLPGVVRVFLDDEIKDQTMASGPANYDCLADPSNPQGNTRLWYTIYVDDYFWRMHETNGEPRDPLEFASDIHAFWTTRSDGRWQTHVYQPYVPTCVRYIMHMPGGTIGGPSAVRTEADLRALRDYENSFSDAGQIVAAMGVGEIEFPGGSSYGYTIPGTHVSDLGNLPAIYFDGADTPWYADRLFTHEMGHAFGAGHSPCDVGMAGHGGDPWVHIMAFSQDRDPSCKPYSPWEQHLHWIFKGADAAKVFNEYARWCAAVGGADCAS